MDKIMGKVNQILTVQQQLLATHGTSGAADEADFDEILEQPFSTVQGLLDFSEQLQEKSFRRKIVRIGSNEMLI